MKRRDFLKGILSTPVAAVGIALTIKAEAVMKPVPTTYIITDAHSVIPKGLSSKDICNEALSKIKDIPIGFWKSSSELYDPTSEYFKAQKEFAEQLQRKADDMIIEALKGEK